jgi:hypothetical protein
MACSTASPHRGTHDIGVQDSSGPTAHDEVVLHEDVDIALGSTS